MIFMVLQAKDSLGRVPRLNEDLLDIQRYYLDRGDMFWLAIDDAERVIGCIGYNRIEGTQEAWIHRLYIKYTLKRRGIGTALLTVLENHAKQQGIAVLHVHLGGKEYYESRQFYPKHGYREYAPSCMKKELQTMLTVTFYPEECISDSRLVFAVVAARYEAQWIFCRHKDRHTWEIPGGHREPGESIEEAARRELWEETGALEAKIVPVCAYQVNQEERCGMLFFAQITKLGQIPPESEMKECRLSDLLPQNLTYPGIQPQLFERVQAWRSLQTSPEERWDIYDASRNPTGRLHRRGDPLKAGDFHLVVHVWLQNQEGKFLLTQRAPHKGYPNLWETTGGSALAGDDSMSAALREAREETGMLLSPEQGRLVLSYQREDAFVDVWVFHQAYSLAAVQLQPEETVNAMYADAQTVLQLAKEGKLVPYPYLKELLHSD